MLKKIVLFALVLIPAITFAQESQKIAYFKYSEVIQLMPEFVAMQDSLKKQAAAFQTEMEVLQADYTKKLTDYQEQESTLVESIKLRRVQEIEGIRENLINFQQQAQQMSQKLQNELFTPIEEKLLKTIAEVGTENHFAYILEATIPSTVLFISPQNIDATPLVKAKLGLK
jgi:outer membrane protein